MNNKRDIINKDNEELINRLYNWKFKSAIKFLNGEDEYVKDVVNTLNNLFGNCGWILSGEMADMVEYALVSIGLNEVLEEGEK